MPWGSTGGDHIADKWLRAEFAYMLLAIWFARARGVACTPPLLPIPVTMFWVMLVNAMAYMPTIALSFLPARFVLLSGEKACGQIR